MPHRIVAVIPVFRAPESLPSTIESILRQVDSVVVVDDGSRSVDTITFPERTEVISAGENRGIATALNTAISRARELGATHILTLDQDSALADGHVERLLSRIDAAEAQGVNVAAAVPGVVGGAPVLNDPTGGPFDPIQSGQLLPVGAFEAIGEFRTDLFIDAVDSEFTVRAREAGYQFLVDEGLAMEHALGRRCRSRCSDARWSSWESSGTCCTTLRGGPITWSATACGCRDSTARTTGGG